MNGELHAAGALSTPRHPPLPDRGMGGPQSQSGHCEEKIITGHAVESNPIPTDRCLVTRVTELLCFFISLGGVSPLGTSATNCVTVPYMSMEHLVE
jgi:hypothetical protein